MPEEQTEWVPEELDAWLSERASETGRDRDEVLARAVATYRRLSTTDRRLAENGAAVEDPLDERFDPLDDRLADLDARLVDLEKSTDADVQDLRERVVQVLQTARSKADADHDHAGLDERLADAAATTQSLADAVDSLAADLSTLEERVDGGFENYEVILESLSATADELDGKAETLASAVVDLRRRTAELEAASARRDAVEELQAAANREGVGVADCEACGFEVDLGLLASPRCPRCASVFDGVSPGRRFFGRATMTVGERPALEAETTDPESPEDVFDGEERAVGENHGADDE